MSRKQQFCISKVYSLGVPGDRQGQHGSWPRRQQQSFARWGGAQCPGQRLSKEPLGRLRFVHEHMHDTKTPRNLQKYMGELRKGLMSVGEKKKKYVQCPLGRNAKTTLFGEASERVKST